jgi:hypothetical protein
MLWHRKFFQVPHHLGEGVVPGEKREERREERGERREKELVSESFRRCAFNSLEIFSAQT